jgi:hypothetical protein
MVFSSMKLFELRPFTAWLATTMSPWRKNGSAMPHPVSGAASAYFWAAVESPAMWRVRGPRCGRAEAGAAAATARGRAATAAEVTCLRVRDTDVCLSTEVSTEGFHRASTEVSSELRWRLRQR